MKSAHTFRQSWAKDFLMCPERGRRSAFDPAWDSPDSDATVLGTAVHEYMEGRLHGLSHGEALHDAMAWLDTRLETGDFQRVQIKGDDTLRETSNWIVRCFKNEEQKRERAASAENAILPLHKSG
jgi:hypothetical protein